LDQIQGDQQRQIASDRRKQVGSAQRSEKIRTYNFPDRRVTDHRAGITLHKLDLVMEGELQELIDALTADEQTAQRQLDGTSGVAKISKKPKAR
jgi:peptide chain release factor 1